MRDAAVRAFMFLDSDTRIRRCLLAQGRPLHLQHLVPGSQVMFWNVSSGGLPSAKVTRRVRDPRGWQGPATCVAPDGPTSWWSKHRGRLHRVPLEMIRDATSEEVVALQFVLDDLKTSYESLSKASARYDDHRSVMPTPDEQTRTAEHANSHQAMSRDMADVSPSGDVTQVSQQSGSHQSVQSSDAHVQPVIASSDAAHVQDNVEMEFPQPTVSETDPVLPKPEQVPLPVSRHSLKSGPAQRVRPAPYPSVAESSDLLAEVFNIDLAASMREDLGRNVRERGGLHEELECMHADVIPLEDCKCEDMLAAEPLAKTTVKAVRKSDFRRRNEINFRNLSRENQILMYEAMRQELGSQDVLGAIRKLKHQEIR